jgi:hypothetical protein
LGGTNISPCPSADGLTLYFASSPLGAPLIFRATRATPYGQFGTPVLVSELASTTFELEPCVRSDDLEIFFVSIRAGGPGGLDLWQARRSSRSARFGVPTPVVELNTTDDEHGPCLTGDGLRIYFASNRPGGLGVNDLFTATRPNWSSPFGAPVRVTELNTGDDDVGPHVSLDGNTIFFERAVVGVPPFGDRDLWMATRLHAGAPFGNAVPVVGLNTTAWDESPGFATFHDEVFYSIGVFGIGSWIVSTRFTGLLGNGIASASSAQDLRFSAPGASGSTYLAGSSFGSTPGIRIDNRVLPLNPDPLLQATLGGLPPFLSGYAGVLDQDGIAAGRLSFVGLPQLAGLRFFTAFVVLDPMAPSGIRTISNSHEVLIQP